MSMDDVCEKQDFFSRKITFQMHPLKKSLSLVSGTRSAFEHGCYILWFHFFYMIIIKNGKIKMFLSVETLW